MLLLFPNIYFRNPFFWLVINLDMSYQVLNQGNSICVFVCEGECGNEEKKVSFTQTKTNRPIPFIATKTKAKVKSRSRRTSALLGRINGSENCATGASSATLIQTIINSLTKIGDFFNEFETTVKRFCCDWHSLEISKSREKKGARNNDNFGCLKKKNHDSLLD